MTESEKLQAQIATFEAEKPFCRKRYSSLISNSKAQALSWMG